MCYICARRLRRLLEKGYIFQGQVDEVTNEIKKEIETALRRLAPELQILFNTAAMDTADPSFEDLVNAVGMDKSEVETLKDQAIDRLLKQNITPGKVH